MTDLKQLALRCEQAEGLDRGLDDEIHFAITEGVGCGMNRTGPHFTASIDAALTLVPGGCDMVLAAGPKRNKVSLFSGPGRVTTGKSATPALALCAAALRARSGRADAA